MVSRLAALSVRFAELRIGLLALVLSACGPQAPSQQHVVGGRPVAANSPAASSVVRILVSGQTRCTGTLIGQDLVLLASHCVSPGEEGALTVAFPRSPTAEPLAIAELRAFRADASAFFPLFDLTWVRLQGPAPAPYRPVPLLLDPARLQPGARVTIAGFGQDCPTGTCPDELSEGESRWQTYTDRPHQPSLITLFGQIAGGESGTCRGDSGGPSFVRLDQRWFLVGVTNGKHPIISPQAYTEAGEVDCGSGWTIQTFVGDYLSWLEASTGTTLLTELPRPERASLVAQTEGPKPTPRTWSEWFDDRDLRGRGWATVHKVLEQLYIQERSAYTGDWSRLFTDAEISASLIDRITTLALPGLGFPDREFLIDDLRPIATLPQLRELNLRDVSYTGLEKLAEIETLESLTIAATFATRPPAASLGLHRLASPSLRVLNIRGLALADLKALSWSSFPQLQDLSLSRFGGGVPASLLAIERLPSLSSLTITDLDCDVPTWNPNPNGTLRRLVLRKSSQRRASPSPTCVDPEALRGLESVLIE